jgi:hypothetical protein
MSRSQQIVERLDAGDHAGAVRLATREKIAALKKAQRSETAMQLVALEELVRRHPEVNCEFYGSQLRLSLAELGLRGTTIEEMETALAHIQEKLAPVAEWNEARRQVRARQEVTAPPAAATAQPEPEDAVTTEAKQLIAQGRITRESIAAMTSLQYERAISSPVFNRCLELLEPPRDPSPLTWGEVQQAHGQAHRMNQQQGHAVITADIVRAVEESKRTHWTSVYQDPPAPSSPRSASRSVVNLNRAQHISKPLPSLRECLTQEQKDQKWLDEQRSKSGRAIRVRANRGKA